METTRTTDDDDIAALMETAATPTKINESTMKKVNSEEEQLDDREESEMSTTANNTSSSSDCPLFMDGLPSDFAQNSALTAIASLINDDDDFKDDIKKSSSHFHLSTGKLKSGGGKIKMTGNKRNNRHSPYSKDDTGATIKGEKKATLGEAQLFLGLWKI